MIKRDSKGNPAVGHGGYIMKKLKKKKKSVKKNTTTEGEFQTVNPAGIYL